MEQKPLGPDAILEEKGSILELARGIEPPTGGLQTNEVTNEDDVSLCKITNHDLE